MGRIERLILATNPVSTGLINRLFRAFLEHDTGAECDADIYVANPEAQDFSVEDVIANFDESESESDSEESSDTDIDGHSCSTMGPLFCHQAMVGEPRLPVQQSPW